MKTDDKGADVVMVVLNGVKYVQFDGFILVPAWKLRELFLSNYAKWKKTKRGS